MSSTSSWPPTSPPAGWTSSGSATSSTSTSPPTPSPTSTASAAPAGRAAAATRSRSSRRASGICCKSIEKATRQSLTAMQTAHGRRTSTRRRLARFDDAITQALASEDLEFFREVVGPLRARARRARGRCGGRPGAWCCRGTHRCCWRDEPDAVRAPADRRGPTATQRGHLPDQRGPAAEGRSRVRSSVRWPTRAACASRDFGHIDIRADHTPGRTAREPARRDVEEAAQDADLRQVDRLDPR